MNKKMKWMAVFFVMLLSFLMVTACGETNQASVGEGTEEEGEETSDEAVAEEAPTNESTFPEKEVTIVVSNSAGGSNDLAARSIAGPLQEVLGVPVVVENVDGAGGNIARAQVFNAEPDGYTLLKTPIPSMSIGELVADGDFQTMEFEPVFNMFGHSSNVVIVPADSEIDGLEELIEASENQKLRASGSGMATNTALGSIFLKEIGVDHQYIPYEGGSESAQQVAGGHVDFGIASEIAAKSLEEEGLVKVIATTATERLSIFPDAPTLIELGYPELGFEILYGIWAPPNTPSDVVEILADAFLEASQEPAFSEAAERVGFVEQILMPYEFRERRDIDYLLVEKLKDQFEVE